jgi:hypothetical protein
MSHRRVAQTLDVVRRRLLEPAPHNHSETVADSPMAWRAVNVIPLLPAQDNSLVDCDRKVRDVPARGVFTFVKSRVFFERATRDRAFHRLPLAAAIGEKFARALWPVFRLVLHVETRTACRQQTKRSQTEA